MERIEESWGRTFFGDGNVNSLDSKAVKVAEKHIACYVGYFYNWDFNGSVVETSKCYS